MSPMIAASSRGRDHIGQWLVGRSIQVTSRNSARPRRNAHPCSTPFLYSSDGKPVAMTVVARSRRFSLRQLRSLAEDTARLRHRALPECLELLVAEPVQVLLLGELLRRRQRELDALEVGIHCADARAGVDVDHRCDQIRDTVARGVARESGTAVHGEHGRTSCRSHRLADRFDVIRQRDRGAVGLGGLESGKRYRRRLVALLKESGDDLVPRPGAEPEAGDEDDRSRRHASILCRRGHFQTRHDRRRHASIATAATTSRPINPTTPARARFSDGLSAAGTTVSETGRLTTPPSG